jgi:hypothetical protein
LAQIRYITVNSDLYDGEGCYVTFLDNSGVTTNLGFQMISFSFETESDGGTCFVYVPSVDNTFVINVVSYVCPTPTPTTTPTNTPI